MDPLAGAAPDVNPYQFAAGDPVNFNDPHGDLVHEPPTFAGGGGDEARGGGFGGMDGANRGYGGSPVADWGSGFYGGGPAGIDLSGGGGSAIGAGFIPGVYRGQAGYWSTSSSSVAYNNPGRVTQMNHPGEVTSAATFIPSNETPYVDPLTTPGKLLGVAGTLNGFFDMSTGIALLEKGSEAGEKLAKGTGTVGAILTIASIGYEYKSKQADTHTFINAGLGIVGTGLLVLGGLGVTAIAGVAIAPIAVTVGVVGAVYGLVSLVSDLDSIIDSASGHWGREVLYGK